MRYSLDDQIKTYKVTKCYQEDGRTGSLSPEMKESFEGSFATIVDEIPVWEGPHCRTDP